MSWYSLRVDTRADRDAALAALFAAGAQGVQELGSALLTSFPDEAAARAAAGAVAAADPAATIDLEATAPVDWSVAWRDHARVASLGRLTICPPWLAAGRDPSATVVIDPGMAFGTGDHASTRGAARLLEQQVRPGQVVADLGSGSAVLSIAAARLGAARVWAIESDPDAQENAAANVTANGVTEVVHLLEGDAGLLLPAVAPVDLVVANIISSVILELLPAVERSLVSGGSLIVAGILAAEQDTMTAAFGQRGWSVTTWTVEEGWWSALLVRR